MRWIYFAGLSRYRLYRYNYSGTFQISMKDKYYTRSSITTTQYQFSDFISNSYSMVYP